MVQNQAQRQEPSGRQVLFSRKEAEPEKSKENIILAFNEALQKVGESATIQFSRVGYFQSRAISALLIEIADATELLKI